MGIGEMDLAPDAFWSLTVREFQIKHAAFMRAEDRRKSLAITQALLSSGHMKKADRERIAKSASDLVRYPQKSWLRPKSR